MNMVLKPQAPDVRVGQILKLAVMAVGALVGGNLGGRLAGRLDPNVFRWLVVAIGVVVAGIYIAR